MNLLMTLAVAHLLAASPYPPSPVTSGIKLDWSTHRRSAQGSDNFQLTWADDDHLYGAWGDGGGFGGTNRIGRVGLGVARIEGSAGDYKGFNVWGGNEPTNQATFNGKSWGMICIEGTLYMWVVPDVPTGKSYRNHYEYVELARSRDKGRSWSRAPWRFEEAEELTIPTFVNFGRDNRGVPAELQPYVYSYFIRPQQTSLEQAGPNGSGLIVHKPGTIFLCRAPANELWSSKNAYEFYRGTDGSGRPMWGSLAEKRPVFLDPSGVGWCLSACYHPTLQRFLLCTEHTRSSAGFLGIFEAPKPWGPWSTVEYYDEASPFGHSRPGSALPWTENVFFLAFATKWLDGREFTLNFTGAGQGKNNDSFNTVAGEFK